MSGEIKPFKVSVPDSALQTVKAKLALATFPKEVEFSDDWDFGSTLSDVTRLAKYWRDGFDWRAQEAKLNEYPQFTTTVNVDGFGDLRMHFLHQKSTKAGSIPLLFVHGWPGSYLEVLKILPLLTDPDSNPSFHIVAPSLPNYGFSDGVTKKGFSIPQYAEAVHKVMLNLGYKNYVTQGGDWGFAVTRMLGLLYPEHCLASHLNMIRTLGPPSFTETPWQYVKHAVLPYSEAEKAGRARSQWFRQEGYGYNVVQSTKPSTIGFALVDSPVALLAWIYEKLHDWADDYKWTDDEILTWISIYQFSVAGPEASARIYYEATHSEREKVIAIVRYVSKVPLGLSYFPRDIVQVPMTWGRTLGPVVFETVHSDGGHFAAHERPEALVDDLRKMFGEGGGAHDVAKKLIDLDLKGSG